MYYRAFIAQFDSSENNDVLQLKVYLVDYGVYVDDIRYNINPNALKFLHKDFSSLQTEVYDCRLANIRPSQPDSDQWPDEAKNLIGDHCYDKPFLVKITGYVESTLCVYLWLDDDCEQSVNELLIRNRLAVEFNDEEYPDVRAFHTENDTDLIIPFSSNPSHFLCKSTSFFFSLCASGKWMSFSSLQNSNISGARCER